MRKERQTFVEEIFTSALCALRGAIGALNSLDTQLSHKVPSGILLVSLQGEYFCRFSDESRFSFHIGLVFVKVIMLLFFLPIYS